MLDLLNNIRKPVSLSLSKKIINTVIIFFAGVALGLLSKLLDTTPSNYLPYFLERLDLGNFFSRMGIWIFLAVVISVYSKSPIRSAINVFIFLAGMLGSYYFYTVHIAGFFPRSYMMIWVTLTFISPIFAFVCWYAKGNGMVATLISSVIFMVMSHHTFAFGFWYFDVRYFLEFLLWIATIIVLYKSPKQIVRVFTIGMVLFFLTARINIIWFIG